MYKVREVNWNDPKYKRAGIIPIVERNGILFFGFGVGNGTAELSDFGGGKETIDQDLLDTALREYSEESYNIFGELTRENVQDYDVFFGKDTIEILVPVNENFYDYTRNFAHFIGNDLTKEIINIVWMSRLQVLNLIEKQEERIDGVKIFLMYYRILETLKLNKDLI